MSKSPRTKPLGMLKSCDSDQICTIHRLVTFEPKSLEGEGMELDHTKNSQTTNSVKTQPTTNNSHDVQSVTKIFLSNPKKKQKRRCKHYSKMKCPR